MICTVAKCSLLLQKINHWNTDDLKRTDTPKYNPFSVHGLSLCVLYTSIALKHAASAASRLDTRPHTPRGIIALHPTIDRSLTSPFVSPPLDASRETTRAGELVPANKKGKGPVVEGLKRNLDWEWRAKTKNDRNRTLRESEKVCRTIIDLSLERASSRWLYLKVTGEKSASWPLRAFLQRLFLLLLLDSSRRTVLSVRYTAWWRAKQVRELSCAWRVRNAVVINVAYEW
jgi:hypothetical protein